MVRETGQGEVYRAGDREDYLRAIRAVLADPAKYRAAYETPGLLAGWTWKSQVATLDKIYARLMPAPAATSPVSVPVAAPATVAASVPASLPAQAAGPNRVSEPGSGTAPTPARTPEGGAKPAPSPARTPQSSGSRKPASDRARSGKSG
jgi:hypothetical protein